MDPAAASPHTEETNSHLDTAPAPVTTATAYIRDKAPIPQPSNTPSQFTFSPEAIRADSAGDSSLLIAELRADIARLESSLVSAQRDHACAETAKKSVLKTIDSLEGRKGTRDEWQTLWNLIVGASKKDQAVLKAEEIVEENASGLAVKRELLKALEIKKSRSKKEGEKV